MLLLRSEVKEVLQLALATSWDVRLMLVYLIEALLHVEAAEEEKVSRDRQEFSDQLLIR